MQISARTLAVLKNFGTVSDRIHIDPGNVVQIAAKTAVYAKAIVPEVFPVPIDIYDLPEFMSVVGMFKNPGFYFEQDFVRIVDGSDGNMDIVYVYAPPSLVPERMPAKLALLPPENILIELSEEDWVALEKACSVLKRDELKIESDGACVRVSTHSQCNPDGHVFSVNAVGDPQGRRCRTILQMANLKLLRGSYKAIVTPNYIVFHNRSGYDLTYWIGCDPQSTFE